MLNTCMRDIIVYTWRQTEYAYKVPELLRALVGKNITPEIESKLTEAETCVDEMFTLYILGRTLRLYAKLYQKWTITTGVCASGR